MPSQTDNGKAFEFSIANTYYQHLSNLGLAVTLVQDGALATVRAKYNLFSALEKARFDAAAQRTVDTLLVLEPGLRMQRSERDVLTIRVASDAEGQLGDVRDVIFRRAIYPPVWEIGISAKNNHDAAKHSRLSPTIDFGNDWMGHPCSTNYFSAVNLVFRWLESLVKANARTTWASLGNAKNSQVYHPILLEFRNEMMRLDSRNPGIPQKLMTYLIGRHAFYKVIKDDRNNCVLVKAYNLNRRLNRTVNRTAPSHFVDPIKLPTRIIEFDFVPNSDTTLKMILDQGWQISFRIHNASSLVETSLKFDIKLIGNPPILFTQHLFV